MNFLISLLGFLLAGVAEISGGYLVWISIKDHKGVLVGLLGAVILILYGIIPTVQRFSFSQTYATYGGFFVILSLIWGRVVNKDTIRVQDVIGCLIILVGISVIAYLPRR